MRSGWQSAYGKSLVETLPNACEMPFGGLENAAKGWFLARVKGARMGTGMYGSILSVFCQSCHSVQRLRVPVFIGILSV